MVAHYKITIVGYAYRTEITQIFILRRHIRFRDRSAIHVQNSLPYFDHFSRQRNYSLDKTLRAVQRVPEHHDIPAMYGLEPVNKFVDENSFLVGKQRRHARAL